MLKSHMYLTHCTVYRLNQKLILDFAIRALINFLLKLHTSKHFIFLDEYYGQVQCTILGSRWLSYIRKLNLWLRAPKGVTPVN